jgi:hypothetical protein
MNKKKRQGHLTGAISELKAATWFLQQGYEVFTAVLPQTRTDMVVLDKEGKTFRVQVKTATWSKAGKWSYLQSRVHPCKSTDYEEEDFDLWCVVYDDVIWVIPWKEVFHSTTNLCLAGSKPGYQGQWDQYKYSI